MSTATKEPTKLNKTQERELHALQDLVRGTEPTFLECRDMRHAWKLLNDFHVESASSSAEIRRDLCCTRCEAVRREVYVNTVWGLDRISTSYTYPENYEFHNLPKGVPLQKVLRGEQFRRSLERVVEDVRRA